MLCLTIGVLYGGVRSLELLVLKFCLTVGDFCLAVGGEDMWSLLVVCVGGLCSVFEVVVSASVGVGICIVAKV